MSLDKAQIERDRVVARRGRRQSAERRWRPLDGFAFVARHVQLQFRNAICGKSRSASNLNGLSPVCLIDRASRHQNTASVKKHDKN